MSTQDTLTCTAPVLPALSGYSFHPRWAHLAVTITPRTHCHFLILARAVRVPELCDNHTSPSCLVTNSPAKPRFRSVYTSLLPDPLLTQGSSVIFPVCAFYLLFVSLCVLAHFGPYCSHVCAYTHLQLASAYLFGVLPSSLSVLRWQNTRMRGAAY